MEWEPFLEAILYIKDRIPGEASERHRGTASFGRLWASTIPDPDHSATAPLSDTDNTDKDCHPLSFRSACRSEVAKKDLDPLRGRRSPPARPKVDRVRPADPKVLVRCAMEHACAAPEPLPAAMDHRPRCLHRPGPRAPDLDRAGLTRRRRVAAPTVPAHFHSHPRRLLGARRAHCHGGATARSLCG